VSPVVVQAEQLSQESKGKWTVLGSVDVLATAARYLQGQDALVTLRMHDDCLGEICHLLLRELDPPNCGGQETLVAQRSRKNCLREMSL
jgi:hypothetical protein